MTTQTINYIEWMDATMVAKPIEKGGYSIAKQTQSKYRMKGLIPYYKVGKFIRYKRSELDKWLEDHQVQGVAS